MKRNVPNETKSVSQEVKEFISRRPFIIEALRQNIINYTALARIIKKGIKKGSLEAIKIAIFRERENILLKKGLEEKKILSLLKKTKVNLQDKISVIISEKELDIPYLVVATLEHEFVYIIDQTQKYESLTPKENIKAEKDLVALILKSPEEIENIPGFVAFVSQLLASKNINMKQFLSCYNDTIIILEPKDALQAFSLLREVM